MFSLGITGGIASGKSSVAAEFAKLGAHVWDADDIARQLVEPDQPALTAIIDHFGGHLLLPNGHLDRPQLRALIFNSPSEKVWLEQLLHPLVHAQAIANLASVKQGYGILVSPLLFESGQNQFVSRTLVIDVPESLQLERAMARDNNSAELIESIMANQLPRAERLKLADDILDNSGSFTDTQAQIYRLHQHYLQLAQQS